MTIKIDRGKWRYGGTQNNDTCGPTNLLNREGNMCCLGFISEQRGIPREQLIGVGLPEDIAGGHRSTMQKIPELVISYYGIKFLGNTSLASDAIAINDAPYLTTEEREEQLTNLFKEKGVEIEFVGEYPDQDS